MSEYVSQVTLEINGQIIYDFNTVEEGEYELRRPVKLMNKTGHTKVKPQYPLAVEYVIPKDAPEFDFDGIEEGTLTIDYENGTRKTYTGVATLRVGAVRHDSSKDGGSVRTIDLLASGRVIN